MVNHESRAWRILGRSEVWVMGLAVLACAPGDANRGGDTAAVATPIDTAQSTTATGTDTAAAGQTQPTADTAPQQTAAAPADTLRDTATTKPPTPETAAQRRKAGAVAAKRAATSNTAATSTTSTATTDTATTASAAPSAETATTQQGGGGDKMLVSEEVYNGWKTFNANCNRCHGDDAIAAAGGIAPDLRQSIEQGRVNHEVYQQVVIDGRIQKGMPPWKDLLTEQQVEDIWQYLQARTKGGLPPGRPKRKEG